MDRHLKAFKAIAAQVAHRHGFGFGLFLGEHGLKDFLLDVKKILDGGGQLPSILRWIESYYA